MLNVLNVLNVLKEFDRLFDSLHVLKASRVLMLVFLMASTHSSVYAAPEAPNSEMSSEISESSEANSDAKSSSLSLSLYRKAILSDQAQHHLLLDITESNQERLIAVGDRGHILYSDDTGKTWIQAEVPTQNLLTAVTMVGLKGWAVGHDGMILHTDDQGTTWRLQHLTPMHGDPFNSTTTGFEGVPLLDVAFVSEQVGFAVGAYGLFLKTEDGGQQWSDVSTQIDNLDGFHLNTIHTVPNTKTLFITGESGSLFRSQDGGEQWERLNSPYHGSFFGLETGLGLDQLYLYGLGGKLFKSEDAGEGWRPINVTQQAPSKEVVTDTFMASTVLSNNSASNTSKTNRRVYSNHVNKNSHKSLILVGNGGVVVELNPQTEETQVHYRESRQSLSGVVDFQEQVFVVGKDGVVLHVY